MSSPLVDNVDSTYFSVHTRSRSVVPPLPPPIPAKPRSMSNQLHVNVVSPSYSNDGMYVPMNTSRPRETNNQDILPVMSAPPTTQSMRERLQNFISKKSTICSPTMGDQAKNPSQWVGKQDHNIEDLYTHSENGLKIQKKVGTVQDRISQISIRFGEKVQAEQKQESGALDDQLGDQQGPVRQLYKQFLKTIEEFGKSMDGFGQSISTNISTPQQESYKQSEALRKQNQSEFQKEAMDFKKLHEQLGKQDQKCRQVWESLSEQESTTFKLRHVLANLDGDGAVHSPTSNSANGTMFLDINKSKEKTLLALRKVEKSQNEQVDKTGKEFGRYQTDLDKALLSHTGFFDKTRPICVRMLETLEKSRIERIKEGMLRFSETLQKLSELTWHVAELSQQAEAIDSQQQISTYGLQQETSKGVYIPPAQPVCALPLPAQKVVDGVWQYYVDVPYNAPAHCLFFCKQGNSIPGQQQVPENSYILVKDDISARSPTINGIMQLPSIQMQPSTGVISSKDQDLVRWSETPPLALVLTTPEACAQFKDHLLTEYSQENIQFWKKALDFRLTFHLPDNTQSPKMLDDMHTVARDIMHTFVLNTATTQVNLKADVLRELEAIYTENKQHAYMFVRAEREIYHLLSNDSFARFKKSEPFIKFLISKKV